MRTLLCVSMLLLAHSVRAGTPDDLLLQTATGAPTLEAATQGDAVASACRQAPDSHCLLRIAMTLADGLDDGYGRESTLARIAAAQTGAGDIQGALITAKKITDVANYRRPSPLATIAEAQAANGDISGAFATARMMGDGSNRALALTRLARAFASAGDFTSARRAVDAAMLASQDMPDGGLRASTLAWIAAASAAAEDRETASHIFDQALAVANALQPTESRPRALAWVAEAQAAAGFVDAALGTAKAIEYRQLRSRALAATAKAQAAAGKMRAALATAGAVDNPNERVEAFTAIALEEAIAGDLDAARQHSLTPLVIARAIAITWEATDYVSAMARTVEVQAAIGEIEAALESIDMVEEASMRRPLLAGVAAADFVTPQIVPSSSALAEIDDPLLRALTLAAVARAQDKARNADRARELGAEALRAAVQIGEPTARATVLMALIETRARLEMSTASPKPPRRSTQFLVRWRTLDFNGHLATRPCS